MTDPNTSDMSDATSSAGASLKEAGRETYEQAKSKAKDAVSRTTQAAKAQALGQAETAKDALASSAEKLADSLRGAADEDTVQARLMSAAADTISDLSHSLRGRSLNGLMSDAESFARRNPGAFVAAAALAGFAIARFARASAPREPRDPYAGYGGMAGTSASGMGSDYATGTNRTMGGHVSTTGMSTHDDDADEPGFAADRGDQSRDQ